MEKARIEFLENALKNNPDDTFARYALAMELSTSDNLDEAWLHFNYLLTHHPNYAPTYNQAGMCLLNRGQREDAKHILAKGVEVTGRQGNRHAQSELQNALDELSGE